MRRAWFFLFLACTATAQNEPLGIDNIDLVFGAGERTDNYRIALQWDVKYWTNRAGTWDIIGSITPNYSVFDSDIVRNGERIRLRDIGITPTITFQPRSYSLGPFVPYIDMGIGFHYLTDKKISLKTFSTNFQFGDHIGMGLKFGPQLGYKLGYSFQHLSNGGIDAPNPGINFHLVSLGFKLPW